MDYQFRIGFSVCDNSLILRLNEVDVHIIDRINRIAASIVAEAKVLSPEGRRKSWKIVYPDGSVRYSPTKPSDSEVSEKPPVEEAPKKSDVQVSKKDLSDIRKTLKKELVSFPKAWTTSLKKRSETFE